MDQDSSREHPDAPPRLHALHAVPRFAILMASLLSVAAFPQSAVFRVGRIDVVGSATLAPEAVVALAGIERGQRLFAVRAANAIRRLRTHPRVKTADVRIRPPDTVAIIITERRPVIALMVGDQFVLLDDELVAVAVTSGAAGLPEVEDRTGRVIVVGRPGIRVSSEGARIALAALAAASPMRREIGRIRVAAGPDLTMVTWSGLEIRAGGLWGLADRLAQVQGLLADRKSVV